MRYTYRTFQKRAKLVGAVGTNQLWLVNQFDEWIHDVYEESYIHHGKIYSPMKAFHPLSTCVSGYFQDDETWQWIEVKNGMALLPSKDEEIAGKSGWSRSLADIVRVDCGRNIGGESHE